MAKSLDIDRDSCLRVIRALIETRTLEFDDGEGVVRIDETVTFDRAASRRLGWRLLAGSSTP